ncbi:hypothetical protein, partial [Streptomonospora halophila]|uniref:hypothetical protein n=1 Tax=Streptomonospora halophila TaxID=427369 RepID=UPI0031ED83B4
MAFKMQVCVADAGVEDQLRGDAGVDAHDHDGERVLAPRHLLPALDGLVGVSQPPRRPARVPHYLLEQFRKGTPGLRPRH